MKKFVLVISMLAASLSSPAQEIPVIEDHHTPIVRPLKLSGPRVGITYAPDLVRNPSTVQKMLGDTNYVPRPWISQFGYQFEWRYFETPSGSQGLFEIIPLIGGLDQGLFVPTLNLLVGYRDASGFEIGAGPNLNAQRPGFVFAMGYNFRAGYINFPVNFGFVPTRDGARFTLLVSFNSRKTR